MEAEANSNCAKKQKLDDSSSTNKKKEWPPAYGSQEYWEERYQKHRRSEEKDGEDEGAESDSDALPYHPWYFTYQELSPLILPLILGGRDEGVDLMGGNRKDIVEEINGDDTGDDDEQAQQDSEQVETNNDKSNSDPTTHDESNAQADNSAEESDHSEEEEEEMEDREGLAKHGPISVIEIGCGDMPLGRDLSMELAMLQETTGAKADNIVKEIICCDYSPTVIELCKENQRRDIQASSGDAQNENTTFVVVDYVTADARKLPYPDSSFHLILEKGTLDAMLSDKENGASNCTLIIADCSRVLKQGGEC